MNARRIGVHTLLVLGGCAPLDAPDVEPSWLQDLQVIAVATDPPEVRPGALASVTATVVDPRHRGADVLVWSCTDLGVGCFEQTADDGSPRPLSEWARVAPLLDDVATVTFLPPDIPEVLLVEGGQDLAALVWTLACAPGVCEIMDRVRADPDPGTESWDVAARMLAWPDDWLDEIPEGAASLAVKIVPIEIAGDNANPAVWSDETRIEVPYGSGPTPIELTVTDATISSSATNVAIDAFSTFGPIAASDGAIGSGSTTARLTWEPPPVAGEGRVYAVVRDDQGGVAVWRGDVAVDLP